MRTIVDLLNDAQEKFGGNTAVATRKCYKTRRWSYADLWDLSGRVAAWLQGRGIEKGDRVLLWAPNSLEWVAAFFGCLRAGAVAVPLDAGNTPEFVAEVARRTGAKLGFLGIEASNKADLESLPVVQLEDLECFGDSSQLPLAAVSVMPEDLAELIFTSGTTGDPKGVMLTHGNIYANVMGATDVIPSRPGYRLLSLLPLSHMLEQTAGLLGALTGGASVYYPQSRLPKEILQAFKDQRITTLVTVPQVLRLFMNGIETRAAARVGERIWRLLLRGSKRLPLPLKRLIFAPVHRQLGGDFRFAICGGAYLDPDLTEKWEAIGVPMLQGYGTTEASPTISSSSFRSRRLGAVGKPIPGVELQIAEDGEILVRGDSVTQGYWQDETTTNAAFQDGWYKTGDLGFLDSEGYLYLQGRKKDLIVLSSGLNVYPEDIEEALLREPDVTGAAVFGLHGRARDVRVHAVLLTDLERDKAATVVERVNQGLAAHQRVRDFTIWPDQDFPRTLTQKARKHLILERLQDSTEDGTPRPRTAPSTASGDGQVATLLARFLQLEPERIGPGMRLEADLGLDSLGRMGFLAELETELGMYVDESQVAGDTTVAGLESLAARGAAPSFRPEPWGLPLGRVATLARAAVQILLVLPIMSLLASKRVTGLDRIQNLHGPVLIAVNHLSLMDAPVLLSALPWRWRYRLAIAASAHVLSDRGRVQWLLAALVFNAFPFSQTDFIRPSIERCNLLIDRGWSLLIFPEGRRSDTGLMGPFKSGAGLMAVEFGVPLVPVHLSGTNDVLSKGGRLPRRANVEVRVGDLLNFPPQTPYAEATAAIQQAVETLAQEGPPGGTRPLTESPVE